MGREVELCNNNNNRASRSPPAPEVVRSSLLRLKAPYPLLLDLDLERALRTPTRRTNSLGATKRSSFFNPNSTRGASVQYTMPPACSSSVLVLWGLNEAGQCGCEDFAENVLRVPTPVQLPADAAQPLLVSCGEEHTACVDSAGALYTWGKNDSGQLGNGRDDDTNPCRKPRRVKAGLPPRGKVTALSCGARSTAVIVEEAASDDGVTTTTIYSFGRYQYSNQPHALNPLNHPFANAIITHISCGCDHSAAIDDAGRVLTWGYNERGQLGRGSASEGKQPPALIELWDWDGAADFAPGARPFATHIACGYHHTLIAAKNETFTCGYGEHGQLGHLTRKGTALPSEDGGEGPSSNARRSAVVSHYFESTARRVSVISGVEIAQVNAGQGISAAHTSSGSLYVWGDGRCGSLGLGDQSSRKTPVLMLRSGAVLTAQGPCHSLTVASDGCAYGWGYSAYAQACGSGRLHNGSRGFRFAPTGVLGLAGGEVMCLAAGGGHSAAILRTDALLLAAEAALAKQLRCHLLSYTPSDGRDMALRVANARGVPLRISRLAEALVKA